MAFVQPLHSEKGERRERNERVLENIPVDVMVRISIFPKLPCCICLASSAASLFKSSFFKIESRCSVTDFVGVETQKRESLDDIMLSAILVSSE
jgi:hypothetical protein